MWLVLFRLDSYLECLLLRDYMNPSRLIIMHLSPWPQIICPLPKTKILPFFPARPSNIYVLPTFPLHQLLPVPPRRVSTSSGSEEQPLFFLSFFFLFTKKSNLSKTFMCKIQKKTFMCKADLCVWRTVGTGTSTTSLLGVYCSDVPVLIHYCTALHLTPRMRQ